MNKVKQNEVALLFTAMNFLVTYLKDNEVVDLKEDGDIKFKKPENRELTKVEKRLVKEVDKLLKIIGKAILKNKKLEKEILRKNTKVLDFLDTKQDYVFVFVGLELLYQYAVHYKKRAYNVHPNAAKKLIEQIKETSIVQNLEQKRKANYLDSFFLNSLIYGEEIFNKFFNYKTQVSKD